MKLPNFITNRSTSEKWLISIFLAAAFWFYPSKGHADVMLCLVGIYGLINLPQTVACWRNPAGILFGLGVIYVLLSWTWSFYPEGTERDIAKALPMIIATFGLPAVFNTKQRVMHALLVSAGLITIRLAFELLRVCRDLGWPAVLAEARHHQEYLYTHPQVSSMMAGLCLLVFLAALFRGARTGYVGVLMIAGVFLNVVYLYVMASRGAQAVLAVVCLLAPVLIMPTGRSRIVVLMLSITIGFAAWPLAKVINPRFQNEREMTNFSSRTRVWKYTLHLMESRPLLGYGFGKMVFEKAIYDNPEKTRAPRWPIKYPHAHSYWLMLYFQGGQVGAVLFGAAWLALLARLIRSKIDNGDAKSLLDRMRARTPWALMMCLMSYILLYGIIDYPDHLLRHAQFFLVALILAYTASPRASAT